MWWNIISKQRTSPWIYYNFQATHNALQIPSPEPGMWCARAINASQGSTYYNPELIQSFWSLSVKAWRDKSTFLSRSLISASIRFPSLSNLGGCWNAWTHSSGLLMKWRSKNTPTWRRWYCDLPPPKPPPALTIAAGLSAQQFFPLEAQSSAFFRGATICNTNHVNEAEMVNCKQRLWFF